AQLLAGDENAATHIVQRFTRRLLALASQQMGPLSRRKVEPADVVQSVFKSFFVRQRDGQFRVESWDGLWGLLVTITLRKCCNGAEHLEAACRDVRREVPWPGDQDLSPAWGPAAREPAPEEMAVLAEAVQRLLTAFGEREQGIVRLLLEGHTVSEIS